MFVRVAIPIPSSKTFTYAVPEGLEPLAVVGMRVIVPFGKRTASGFIIGAEDSPPLLEVIKEIISLPDPEPLFSEEDLQFYEWISRYYLHPLGKVLSELLPGGAAVKKTRRYRLGHWQEGLALSEGQRSVVEQVRLHPNGVSLSRLSRVVKTADLQKILAGLLKKGIIVADEGSTSPIVKTKTERFVSVREEPPAGTLTARQEAIISFLKQEGETSLKVLRSRFGSVTSPLGLLEKRGLITFHEREAYRRPLSSPLLRGGASPVCLTPAQSQALEEIKLSLRSREFTPCLLHGVTGSGKTEIYLEAIGHVLKQQGGAIYLVPEIALTAQLLARISRRFPGEEIAVLHSGITRGGRFDQWRRIRRGEIRLVVGARSALFAPVRNLRLIVVDEEHDPSYKQDDRLRYNARDLALVKARYAKAVAVLGSATPSLGSFRLASEGQWRCLSLSCRVDDRPLPKVEIIDLRTERDEKGRLPLLSRRLREAIGQTLAERKQVLLFLNRRGFHTFLFCSSCGHSFTCPNCDVSLTYHAASGELKCHHCDFSTAAATTCPSCRSNSLCSLGAGTERLEEEVGRAFPQARIARMDSDTTARPGDSQRILAAVEKGETDILIGTQMITKGHDFPAITLVGVIAADASLNIPDFRAAERTFQLLTQVSGRSGRGEAPGLVVIQTFNPDHYAISHACRHDYEGFYSREILFRRQLCYPPFSRIIAIHLSCREKNTGRQAISKLGETAREMASPKGTEVIGPAESPLSKIRGRYRWQMLLKGKDSRELHLIAEKLLETPLPAGAEVAVDVDPLNFM